ncbi:MAG: succinate dehydrogenase cytochrome b subunit [Chitinophagales bacterium]|nr:succinate dehydrogenase cytochrome b subunit [Chitinophagales bacterium]
MSTTTTTVNSYFFSSITKKYFMALTGLFLCLFLVGHLAGNLQLLLPLFGTSAEDTKLQFNAYAHFMTTFPAVKLLSYLTYFSIIFHTIDGLMLAYQNQKARPVKYAYNRPDRNSTWSSRNMAILGTILLFFIVIHMGNFWVKMHWVIEETDSAGNKDLYTVVVLAFKQWWYTLLYVVCMVAVGFHLFHGFQSGFQSLGVRHPKYTPFIKRFGSAFAIGTAILFGIIPVYIFLS